MTKRGPNPAFRGKPPTQGASAPVAVEPPRDAPATGEATPGAPESPDPLAQDLMPVLFDPQQAAELVMGAATSEASEMVAAAINTGANKRLELNRLAATVKHREDAIRRLHKDRLADHKRIAELQARVDALTAENADFQARLAEVETNVIAMPGRVVAVPLAAAGDAPGDANAPGVAD